MDDLRRRAYEAIRSADATLAEPRADASGWEAGYREAHPPKPEPDLAQIRREIVEQIRGEMQTEVGQIHRKLQTERRALNRLVKAIGDQFEDAGEIVGKLDNDLRTQLEALRQQIAVLEARLADEPEPETPRIKVVS